MADSGIRVSIKRSGSGHMPTKLACLAIALVIAASSVGADAQEFKNPKANIPPKAAPQRQNAGEGVPPLPLPATPMRRSEKKREPSPPALVGNVSFSSQSLKNTGVNW